MKKEFQIKRMPIFWRESISPVVVQGIPSKMDIKLLGPQKWGGISLDITRDLSDTLKQIYLEDAENQAGFKRGLVNPVED